MSVMESTTCKSLAEAKLAVMAAVSYVQKTKAPKLTYTFASESDVINALRPAMIEHGLTMAPVGVQVVSDEQVTTNSGGTMRRLTIIRQFKLTHAPSGESELIEVLGEAADTGDKAAGKAMTHAKKYALREAFLIETSDDPDYFRSEPDPETRLYLLRYHTAISEATDLGGLNKKMELVEQAAKDGKIDDEQLQEIRERYFQRRIAIGDR